MRVDPATMLVSDLTDVERTEIIRMCSDLILLGKFDWNHPIISQWCAGCELDDRQKLLLISTVMPQRLLLSLHQD
jgi:hypothetical protein